MYSGRPARFRAQAARLDYRGQTTWGELTGCAMKILAARSLGQEPAPQDRRLLTHRLKASRREVWEGNVGAHTLALLALHATDPDDPLLTDGTDALLKVRNPDGGLPFIPDHADFLSAVAALALARSALPSHHQLLLRIGDFLAAHQNPDGGWAFTDRVTQGDTESTGAVLEALHAIDPTRYARALNRGRAHLATLAGGDGGFPTYLPGQPSEAVMTANAICALAPDPARYTPLLRRATLHLLEAQQPDGTFERSWSLAQAHALRRATAALTCLPPPITAALTERIQQALHRADTYLSSAQNPDGGFGHQAGDASDVSSTAHALSAGTSLNRPAWSSRALAYLLAHQQADGGFTSRPEQVAPRPIPYAHPSHASVFALTALGEHHQGGAQRRP